MNWIEQKITIKDKQKLHLRPAQLIVETSSKFQSELKIVLNTDQWNAKSILDMMFFAAAIAVSTDGEFILRANGHDAAEAIAKITNLIDTLPEA